MVEMILKGEVPLDSEDAEREGLKKEMKKLIMRRDFRKSDDPNMIYGRT